MYYPDSLQVSVAMFCPKFPGCSSCHSIGMACLFVRQGPHTGAALVRIFERHNRQSSEYRNLLYLEADSLDRAGGEVQDLDPVNCTDLEVEAEHHHLVLSRRDSGLRVDCCG